MKIITLTLNPAFDVHCYVESFKPYYENLAKVNTREAGGKGVNISRALCACGVENTALVVLGEENAESFRKCLAADRMDLIEITVKGSIRENITIHTSEAPETRISFKGFDADGGLLQRVEEALDDLIDGQAILTLTGRIPEGVDMDDVKRMLVRMSSKGARLVIDSRSFGKQDLADTKPWLIKPNDEEIGMYTDVGIQDFNDAKLAAERLRGLGIENVMISLGSRGAILSCREGCFAARAPRITAVSTVGAGDSTVAGFISAAVQGGNCEQMIRTAVSYGSAACLTEGTRPPRKEDIERLLLSVSVEKI